MQCHSAPWHWFFKNERSENWYPFTEKDNATIEKVFLKIKNKPGLLENIYVYIDKGAIVNLGNRTLKESPKSDSHPVRRCLYFIDSKPVTEEESERLEKLFRSTKKLKHNGITYRRGPGYIEKRFDHLIFVVHGIGDFAKFTITPKPPFLKFSKATQEAHNLENLGEEIIKTNFPSRADHRIKFVPIIWRDILHNEPLDTGLNLLTLPKIPKIRRFVINETGIDVLFYTSPQFQRKILETCVQQMNEHFEKYLSEMPTFKGKVSVVGHSLGGLVVFDILHNQKPWNTSLVTGIPVQQQESENEFPQLLFQVKAFWALGSPIGLFETVRGKNPLGKNFRFPTCPRFYNVFHPNDPVAYRCEPLLNPSFVAKPAEVPRHNGVRRFHSRVGRSYRKFICSINGIFKSSYENDQHKNENTNNTEESLSDLGYLITGHRVDFKIQENFFDHYKPYVTSLSSHLMYWSSRDVIKMIVTETYPCLKNH